MKLFSVFLIFLGITVVCSIIIGDGDSFGSSSSSEESYSGGRGHGGRPGGGRPRPPGGRPGGRPGGGRPPRPRPTGPRCPDGWMRFNRTQGPWCIKVFYAPGYYVTAEALCAANGAKVSGFQDSNERMAVANAGRLANSQNGGGAWGEIWVGAHRNSWCPTARSCAPIDAFSWTDGHTTGKAGFMWAPGEPNTWLPTGGTQDCLIMHTTSFDGQRARFNFDHGAMDDSMCAYTWGMVACGKRPGTR
ncbi:hypothetical protein B9Z55_003648 [Caenorhabditis nigoni]|uniref:C-type lectin domain-containing protein n=1 Tax=Caenorhabditis nigoni TaxID=1611254 RepID=A0A2G5VRV7_9PELO|nr:hypothetical protein B9Z55_003648 [Caenorhabditis nigoni]